MSGEKILLINDDVVTTTWLVEHVLQPAGYVPLTAGDLTSARAQIAAHQPHVVVLKDRLEAVDTLSFLTDGDPRLPVLITMQQPTAESMSAALAVGARDILIEPFEIERVKRSIERALRMTLTVSERDQLRDQIARQNQEFNALYTVGKKASALLDTEEILTLVVSAAVNLTQAEEGSLMLLDLNSGELYLRAHYNLSDAAIQNLRIKITDPLMTRIIQTGRPIMLSGTEVLKSQTALPVKAILGVPLFAGERVSGVLIVANRSERAPFSEHDVHLLSTLADSAAIAIENARLYWEADSERTKLTTILRDIDDVVIVTDSDTRLLLINNAARTAFNLGDEALGRHLGEVINVKAIVDLFDQRKLRSRSWRTEAVLADGRTLQGQLSVLNGIGYGAVLHDITRLKELDRIKTEFVSIVSHDLRTPLTAIRGYVELLPRVGPLNEQQLEFVGRVEHSMTHIVGLISDLLDIGRIEAGVNWQMQPVRLHTLVPAAVKHLQSDLTLKRHTLTCDVPEIAPVLGNAQRLTQVITNLIGNAVKYTPIGGHLNLSAREEGDFLLIQMRDDGIGIAPDDQRRIFDKFFRVHSEATDGITGTGLGLAIVKAIVEKHYGRVWVESEPGHGSTFTVLLPKYEVKSDE
jgi:two-component system NtrC family sensor kinase